LSSRERDRQWSNSATQSIGPIDAALVPMETLASKFNASRFGRWINSPTGRVFRVAAGSAFAIAGLRRRDTPLGKALLAWSVFPLSAGGLDLCWVSGALGGPLRGREARADARRTLQSPALRDHLLLQL
jgi:hypothetical protein